MASHVKRFHQVLRAFSRHEEIKCLAKQNCRAHPCELRKSERQRYWDLFFILAKWNELSTTYHAQNLDMIGRDAKREFLAYKKFQKIRDAGNRGLGMPDYTCLLRDKLLFERYFSAKCFNVMASVGQLATGGAAEFFHVPGTDLIGVAGEHFGGRELFVKPRYGLKGNGAFKLRVTGDAVEVNGRPETPREIGRRITSPCIIQPVIEQHAAIARVHPQSLNTLRIITFRSGSNMDVFLVYLRMAAGGNIVDNNISSRALARVDTQSGRVAEIGYVMELSEVKTARSHPDTGVRFEEIDIPDFDECLRLAKAAHAWMPGLQSIGWDVALTPNGPLLLEGNDDWGCRTAQWVMPDFVEQFKNATKPR
jgi:hypothetical protein